MKEELTDNEHSEILKNEEADLFGRKATFKDYVNIGFDIEEAKNMAGLKNYDFSTDEELQKFIDEIIK
ncbi:MAG: hypothetical protein IPK18_00515 [Sphingobacteriales bacterium]|jgi:UDP-N-acetylglucosamine transferase subunit ALG13|nr:hypothetical protein [Bacteroidota bacterium]QQR98058.1 MAG: hypothetical protein IPK18_00515 [Sphingobacteriales bacterium]